jgi:hypothetical protein
MIQLNTQLKNGFTVLNIHQSSKGYVVLAEDKDSNRFEPFATWITDGIHDDTFCGHYFDNLNDAKSDFIQRLSVDLSMFNVERFLQFNQ